MYSLINHKANNNAFAVLLVIAPYAHKKYITALPKLYLFVTPLQAASFMSDLSQKKVHFPLISVLSALQIHNVVLHPNIQTSSSHLLRSVRCHCCPLLVLFHNSSQTQWALRTQMENFFKQTLRISSELYHHMICLLNYTTS